MLFGLLFIINQFNIKKAGLDGPAVLEYGKTSLDANLAAFNFNNR